MNDNLDAGTAIPEILTAMKRQSAILVMNTNDNFIGDERIPIKGCETAVKAAVTTWKELIENSCHKKIGIIGHSFGGCVALNLASEFENDFSQRVFAVLLTDSAHGCQKMPSNICKNCINFIASDEPLDKDLGNDLSGMSTRSAGHHKHEWTPATSRSALLKVYDSLAK